MTARSRPAAARLAVWSGFLALTLRLLHGATFGRLSVPLGSADELAAWMDHTSPTVMALALVRLVALVAAWYLLGATILAVVADVAGWRRLAAAVAVLSPGIVRRVAARTAGVGLAAGALLAVAPLPSRLLAAPASASAGAGVAADPREHTATDPPPPATRPMPAPTATMAPLPSHPAAPAVGAGVDPRTAAAQRPSGATMARLPDVGPAPEPPEQETASMTRLPGRGTARVATMRQLAWSGEPRSPGSVSVPSRRAPAPAGPDERDGQDGRGGAADTWAVAPRDSFWSIAEEVLAESAGHPPTEGEVRSYWLQLIEANRDRLADRANPDLLIPGQPLTLPPPA